ncbi:hypothetical protein [Streptomyces albogriseolus]|uniref:hypothetical protein n=1 Tax=Streptomyces albogriseolus TaxID=1887 RepID=UPI0036ACFCF0
MAAINPPPWMQAGSYPARNDRLVITSLLSYPGFQVDEATPMRIRQGVKPSYQNAQMKVRAAATPNMTVIVSAGFAFVDQHDTGGSGTYVCVNDADVTLPVAPAGGAGQYRKDAVVAAVYDAEYTGTESVWRLEVIQGSYAASAGAAVRPALPPNAQLLAELAIGPSQTSVSAANITDYRQFAVAAGGITPVQSNSAPPRLAVGQVQYLYDTDLFEVGTLAGPKRRLREVLRPIVTDQISEPAYTNTNINYFTEAQWPSITVTVPPSGMLAITISGQVANMSSATATAWLLWKASGGYTEAGSSKNGLSAQGSRIIAGRRVVRSGLTPGATVTITPGWNVGATTGTVFVRDGQLIVEPIA